jgi:hypothetical protein
MKSIRSIIVTSIAVVIGSFGAGNTCADTIIAEWTFETSVPTTAGPHVAEGGAQAGAAAATGFHTDAGVAYSNPAGNGSNESFSSNFWNNVGDYYQFQFSLIGYQNATFQWDQTRSSTGPADFALQWSTDGINFTTISNYMVPQINWSSTTFNPLSRFGPQALPINVDNQMNVFIRLRLNTAVASTAGTNRVDNIIVEARLIPEPTSAGLVALLMVAGGTIRRRI